MRTSKPRRQHLKVLSSTESLFSCMQKFLLKEFPCNTDVTHAPCFSQSLQLSLGHASSRQAKVF